MSGTSPDGTRRQTPPPTGEQETGTEAGTDASVLSSSALMAAGTAGPEARACRRPEARRATSFASPFLDFVQKLPEQVIRVVRAG